MMLKAFLTISYLILTSSAQDTQVISSNQSLNPNFQGSFDSMTPFKALAPSEQSSQTSPQQSFQHEQLNMLEFSQNLADFIPDQTFTVKLQANQKTSFYLSPNAEVQSIRGMFHCEIDWNVHQEYQSGEYLDLTIMDEQKVLRSYKHQRLGVFSQPHAIKDHRYFFHFSSHQAPIDIYFSYENIVSNRKKIPKQSNETELSKVSKNFAKVSRLLEEQQKQMIRLIGVGDRHTVRIKGHLNQLYWRGIAEGLALIFSALASLWVLRRQIYSQYQSLV